MSWSTDDGSHEGWAAHYFKDGNVSCASSGTGLQGVEAYPALPYPKDPQRWQNRHWSFSDSLGAVAVCSCGWRGSRRPHQDPDRAATEDACHAEWKHHLDFWGQS